VNFLISDRFKLLRIVPVTFALKQLPADYSCFSASPDTSRSSVGVILDSECFESSPAFLENQPFTIAIGSFKAGDGTRTCDRLITNQMLIKSKNIILTGFQNL
jgi:hypothetical protein